MAYSTNPAHQTRPIAIQSPVCEQLATLMAFVSVRMSSFSNSKEKTVLGQRAI